jgi:hypothetical protein
MGAKIVVLVAVRESQQQFFSHRYRLLAAIAKEARGFKLVELTIFRNRSLSPRGCVTEISFQLLSVHHPSNLVAKTL